MSPTPALAVSWVPTPSGATQASQSGSCGLAPPPPLLPALRLSPALLGIAFSPFFAPSVCQACPFCSSAIKSLEALLRSLFLEKAFPPSSEPWYRWAVSSQSALCGGHLWVALPFLAHWLSLTAGTLMLRDPPEALSLVASTGQRGVWGAGQEVAPWQGGGL